MSEPGSTLHVCRVRFLLEATGAAKLNAHQAATVYALFAAAFGCVRGEDDAMPEGVMPDAPEQCRLRLTPGETYALGCTILEDEPGYAARLTRTLAKGLQQVGADKSRRRTNAALAGNFRLREVRDLVAGRVLEPGECPAPIPQDRIEKEKDRAKASTRLTLVFTSPLRMMRAAAARADGHNWLDEQHFDAGLFVVRVLNRLASLGLAPKPEEVGWIYADTRTHENRLVWLDLGYGPSSRRKTLGGGVGRVVIECRNPVIAEALVLGQYAHVGQSTRFGFGAYRIEELGSLPDQCHRAVPLLAAFLSAQDGFRFADDLDLPSGALRRAIKLVIADQYEPDPHARIAIEQPGAAGKTRVLSIPSPLDRALQRALLARLAPALDQFFEESSIAYRQGLGRHRAAHRVQDSFRRGYRFALKSDFRKFFDSIDHALLEARLEAYLADTGAVRAIMLWVRAGAPFENRGVPTGAPISPLISNLFLDSFDEEVSRDGGRLVRYADDFLILYKDQSDAQRVFDEAQAAADSLLLSLNHEKTKSLDLFSTFDFLGFRFDKADSWTMTPADQPRPVDDLGWRQASKKPDDPASFPLPGETNLLTPENRSWVVFGPGASSLRLREDQLVCSYRAGTGDSSVHLDRVREILLLGGATLPSATLHALAERDIRLLVADDAGRPLYELLTPGMDADHEAASGQLRVAGDATWRLALSRRLLVAKISNYAALADAIGPSADSSALPLRQLAARALKVESIESLLGVEGAAAQRWYRHFAARVPRWCAFERRVAPNADDPANILLNLAHTALHRQALQAVRFAGLVPSWGILHERRPGHPALASDLQEPFRHLMDRAVLAVLHTLKPSDFRPAESGPYKVTINPHALRRAIAVIHATFTQPCTATGKTDAFSYLTHLHLLARNLRRHLTDRTIVFEPFVHQEKP